MKVKRLMILTLLFIVIGAATVFADGLQKVKLLINGEESTGIVVDNKTYVPLKDISPALQALVEDDGKKVTVKKPNVHILLYSKPEGEILPFAYVTLGGTYKFWVLSQVDNLQDSVAGAKIAIFDPSNKESFSQVKTDFKESKDDGIFWFNSNVITYKFSEPGKYTARLYLKPDKDSSYTLVSEKTFYTVK